MVANGFATYQIRSRYGSGGPWQDPKRVPARITAKRILVGGQTFSRDDGKRVFFYQRVQSQYNYRLVSYELTGQAIVSFMQPEVAEVNS